jgi:hypothetical protein
VKLRHERIARVVPDDRGGGRGPEVVDGRDEALLHISDLAGQSIGRIPLALPGEGSRAKAGLALSSCSPSGDEGSDESGVGTTGVEEGRGRLRRAGKAVTPGKNPAASKSAPER